jgi:hypothetical protein
VQLSVSREYPLGGSYSTSTDRSSASSGFPNGSPLPQTAKSRYFPFNQPAATSGATIPGPPLTLKGKSEKKEKYRTLGRIGIIGNKSAKVGQPSPQQQSGMRHETMPITAEPVPVTSSDTATQRFIRRVASAPNAKGLFLSGSMFNKPVPDLPPQNKTTGLGLAVSSTHPAQTDTERITLGISNIGIDLDDSMTVDTGSVNTDPYTFSPTVPGSSSTLPTRHPLPRMMSGGSSLAPGASTASLVSTSTGISGLAASTHGPREHRAQSVGTLGKPVVSSGVARLGIGPGPGFRRTYSSNSIKSKTVSAARCLQPD